MRWPPRRPTNCRRRASWKQPAAEEVQKQLEAWLGTLGPGDATKAAVAAIWSSPATAGEELLDRLAATAALADPSARSLVALCQGSQLPVTLPVFQVLDAPAVPALVRNSLRLYYGRWLTQRAACTTRRWPRSNP